MKFTGLRHARGLRAAGIGVALVCVSAASALAATSYKASNSWGNGLPDTQEAGALMHSTYGNDAVRIREGDEATTSNVSNYSIGTQVITSVNGDGNSLDNVSLSGGNTGSVKNQGLIGPGSNTGSTN